MIRRFLKSAIPPVKSAVTDTVSLWHCANDFCIFLEFAVLEIIIVGYFKVGLTRVVLPQQGSSLCESVGRRLVVSPCDRGSSAPTRRDLNFELSALCTHHESGDSGVSKKCRLLTVPDTVCDTADSDRLCVDDTSRKMPFTFWRFFAFFWNSRC